MPPRPETSPFRITGIVINGVTGDPLARCHLSAALLPSGEVEGTAVPRQEPVRVDASTDAQGRFEIVAPAAGSWRVTAGARGFRTQAYDEHEGFSSAVVLTVAAPAIDLTFKLLPHAVVDGFVLDEAGEAVRNAQVSLVFIPPPSPDGSVMGRRIRGNATTDDQGHYEISGVDPGEYLVSLHTQPWYATSLHPIGGMGGMGGAAGPADPLDVAYPVTWYPGVTDFAQAGRLTLNAGDRRQADFHLAPVPAVHLHLPSPAPATPTAEGGLPGPGKQIVPPMIYLTEIAPDGTEWPLPTGVHSDGQGNMEISGLAPGTYQVRSMNGNGTPPHGASLLQIGDSSPRSLDLGMAGTGATVTIAVDGTAPTENLSINFIDTATGRANFVSPAGGNVGMMGGLGLVSGNVPASKDGKDPERIPEKIQEKAQEKIQERSIELIPGRYEVVLNGIGTRYLSGITATGAQATGRIVELHAGEAHLVLHLGDGRGSVSGIVRVGEKPLSGAMVMLVPATLGDPRGLTTLRRDQTNTDGSFRIGQVLPGAYILLAIDQGWAINWSDPATLRRYLLGGVAVDLSKSVKVELDLKAEEP